MTEIETFKTPIARIVQKKWKWFEYIATKLNLKSIENLP